MAFDDELLYGTVLYSPPCVWSWCFVAAIVTLTKIGTPALQTRPTSHSSCPGVMGGTQAEVEWLLQTDQELQQAMFHFM